MGNRDWDSAAKIVQQASVLATRSAVVEPHLVDDSCGERVGRTESQSDRLQFDRREVAGG